VAVFDSWGETDRSHRRLAHRGCYIGRFWASPSTVRRVLTLQDKHFRPLPRPAKGERRPFPDWASYTPNSIWIYDSTHFTRCGMSVVIIEDLVSRKWLTHLVSVEETHVQVENAFTSALEAECLIEAALERAGTGRVGSDADFGLTPILLAVSDNGSQMIARDTRTFMALLAIAQHFGRPSTPTELSRPGARRRDCSRSVSPGRSPNPPCASQRNGLSTASAVRRWLGRSRGWGSCRPGSGTGSPALLRG